MQPQGMTMAPAMEQTPAASVAPKTEESKATNSFADAGFKMESIKAKEFVPAG